MTELFVQSQSPPMSWHVKVGRNFRVLTLPLFQNQWCDSSFAEPAVAEHDIGRHEGLIEVDNSETFLIIVIIPHTARVFALNDQHGSILPWTDTRWHLPLQDNDKGAFPCPPWLLWLKPVDFSSPW